MSHTQLLFRDEARAKILAGRRALADAVRATLGPKSRCVLIEKKWGTPLVCDDGVTIAKEVNLKDPEENLGARMLREAAVRTGDAVGDGTTTSTLLAHAIFAEGLRNVVAGASAIDLKRGLERGLAAAVEALRGFSKPVGSAKEKAQVATISAHNNPTIGNLVAAGAREGRRRGHRHGRGGQGHRDDARGRRGHAVRPRLTCRRTSSRIRRRWRPCSTDPLILLHEQAHLRR